MKTTILIAVCSLMGVLVLTAEDILTTRTETFDTGTGFLSVQRGVKAFGFDIGWQDSNHADGERPGEFGGTFARASTSLHHWADTDIGHVSRRDELEVTGTFIITENIDMDGWIHVGYINTSSLIGGGAGHAATNELGMGIAEPFSTGALFRVSALSNSPALPEPFRRFDNDTGRVPTGQKASFRFLWMPRGDGTGTATLAITLESGEEFVSTVEDTRIPSGSEEMEFDAFVIGASPEGILELNHKMIAFFDDISYTVRGAPASTGDVFGGEDLGDDWFSSSWYGTYNAGFWPWVFHLEHNFQFVFEPDVEGEVFLFDGSSAGWWYTSASIYPSVYMFGRNSWAFYFVDTANPRDFADLASGEFFNVD